ncbi:MAG: preprotein translocase subunit SecA [Tepidisphaerales bacterium]
MNAAIHKLLVKIFGSRNERLLKRYRRMVASINALEPEMVKLTDAELRERAQALRADIKAGKVKLADRIPEAMAIMRESMDRNIGMRSIFNPDENFNPEQFQSNEAYNAFADLEDRIIQQGMPWTKVEIPNVIYDEVRRLYPESRPPFRARCFDVQLIGGLVLYEGKIAEMATGEGKTFVAPLACFLWALEGLHTHVVTVNDYLVRRDATWVRPAFEALGFTVGYIQSEMDPGGDVRRKMYACNVTYGTNAEFGFDFLRDNMKSTLAEQVQGPLDCAIIDEVDSILIDEARTPLIISGPAHDDAEKYRKADAVIRKVLELHEPYARADREVMECKRLIKAAEGDIERLRHDKKAAEAARERKKKLEEKLAAAEAERSKYTQYYEVELDKKSAHLTHVGIAAAQEFAGVGSFYLGDNMHWPHLLEQALRAHVVFERDRDYVVERGQKGTMEVVIVDEYTGRKMVGRQWSDGLHQAVEAKERVPIKEETQTLATITLQNFFKLYKKLAGMTGTAQTEAEEFSKIYKLDVVTIPTNRPRIREDYEDRVYRTEHEKWEAILEEIKAHSDAGRPVLVGTTSVEKSEMLSALLTRKYGIQHEVLNAKFHEREAAIVALAGLQHTNRHGEVVGNVTIATNMAGRGTDIKPAPETFFDVVKVEPVGGKGGGGPYRYTLKQRKTEKEIVIEPDSPLTRVFQLKPTAKVVGGLHVVGTERHTARRIDNQLRGRSGRQGDPGSSRFFVSLQDDLMKMFAGEWTIKVLGFLGMQEGEAIEDRRITKGIERAQRKVEERNYMARKSLLDYDEVMDRQRVAFYGMRQRILRGDKVEQIIWDMIGDAVRDAVDKYITQDHVANVVAEWTRQNFEVVIEPADLYGQRELLQLEMIVKSAAKNDVLTTLPNTLGEFAGESDEDVSTWDLRGLAAWMRQRYHVEASVAEMKKMTPRQLEEYLTKLATDAIDNADCSGLAKFTEKMYAQSELSRWARDKFAIDIDPKEFVEDFRDHRPKPAEVIEEIILKRAREVYARREVEYPVEHVLLFAFGGEDAPTDNPYAAEFLRQWTLQRYGVDLPLEHIRSRSVRQLRDELIGLQTQMLHEGGVEKVTAELLAGNPDDVELARRINERFGLRLRPENVQPTPDPETGVVPGREQFIRERVRGMFRRELTDLEQFVLVQILDQSWKDHLYAMDMLRSGIGLHAFAEKDPRILFKKEGFRYFDEMMIGVREKVTDLIFRARVMGAQPARSVYQPVAAIHQTVDTYGVGEELAATGGLPQPGEAAATAEAEPETAAAGGRGPTVTVTRPITNDEEKVGRNDPCPCGSGKKYKQCCGA